jgi:non-reducing end alpha-L-arabinofuranosidase
MRMLVILLGCTAALGLATEGPCDILDAAGNPCVAAHSTTRALYAKYAGPLYNVTKPDGRVSCA